MSIYIENFETIFGVKNNIQALRNKVLELAIQGKLVEQDPNDEPASELLKKIKIEKNKLIKKGKIKGSRTLASINESKIPFEIPNSWKWCSLGDVGQVLGGGTPKSGISKYWTDNGIHWITPADLSDNKVKYISKGKRDITDVGLKESSAILMPKGTVLFSSRAPIGHIAIASNEICTNQGFKSIVPYIISMNLYIYYFMKWNTPKINESAPGTTFKEVSGAIVSKIIIPIPPIAEQYRIVNKIESLMSEIDKLEERLQKKEHIMELLPKAVVDAIGKCKTGEELKEQLQFVIENFETIFQTPESLQQLRNVVLQLAIEGKLVPQDPADEPASELIKKIKAEKDKLIKEGKIKKQKPFKPISDDEIPFEIPESWEWVRLDNISEINPRNSLDDELDVSFIPMKLIDEGYGSSHKSDIKKWEKVKSGFTHFAENDIAIAKITPCFENRKSAILTDLKSGFGAGTTELHIIRVFSSLISRKYLLYLFKTQWFINSGVSTFTGTAGQQRISTDFIKEYTIPLPPSKEQYRIVQKVDSIMNLIDKIESKMKRKIELLEKIASI